MKFVWMIWIGFGCATLGSFAGEKPLELTDIMRWRHIERPTISENGQWVAYASQPDRGDGEGVVVSTSAQTNYRTPRATKPVFSKSGEWVAFTRETSAVEKEKVKDDKKKAKALKPGLVLLSTKDGAERSWDRVKGFAFSDDSRWLAILFHEPEEKKTSKPAAEESGAGESGAAEPGEEPASAGATEPPPQEGGAQPESKPQAGAKGKSDPKDKPKKQKDLGTQLVLIDLTANQETAIEGVSRFALDPAGNFLAFALSLKDGKGNGLFLRELSASAAIATVFSADESAFPTLVWNHAGTRLAYLQGKREIDDTEGDGEGETKVKPQAKKAQPQQLFIWRSDKKSQREISGIAQGWMVPAKNELTWTKDDQRLFFGLKPQDPEPETAAQMEAVASGDAVSGDTTGESDKSAAQKAAAEEAALFDIQKLSADRGLDVWHGLDPKIKPNERKDYEREKSRFYLAVYHVKSEKVVQLADEAVPDARVTENPHRILLQTDIPYRHERTWSGFLRDYYVADLESGARRKLVIRQDEFPAPTISPLGGFAAYFDGGQIMLTDLKSGVQRNLSKDLDVPFANEDHDYPSPAPGYGFAGWLEKDRALLVYDKFDIWVMPTAAGQAYRLTGGDGRQHQVAYRVLTLDEDQLFFSSAEKLLLRAYSEMGKQFSFYQASIAEAGKSNLTKLLDGEKKYDFIGKAKKADKILFTREAFDEFPDLWVADTSLAQARRLTDENPQIKEFAWGQSELVEWTSSDGVPLQGVLIKPGNYQPGKRYPVIVYFYRFFSQRLYEFNDMAVNHRPNFPYYTSNGYAVFLPDIRFKIGLPGPTSVKALVPGVQKLVDMGIADPKAIGLHGHSWSGYQTAFAITQTDIFACAVAGAPVSNMTSAYSGIRHESGVARQFQYETGQSRIGGSLWEKRDQYIENSPVFFADRIQTPLLIQFGDADGAVPWEQGIELYLALRRLDKDVVFLQYHGEPHHLQKYPNKVDYTIKMKQYFDHYLKGEAAPKWLAEGEAYEPK